MQQSLCNINLYQIKLCTLNLHVIISIIFSKVGKKHMVDLTISILVWFNFFINLRNLVVGSPFYSWHSEKAISCWDCIANAWQSRTQTPGCPQSFSSFLCWLSSSLKSCPISKSLWYLHVPSYWTLITCWHFIAFIYTESFSVGIILL